VILLDPWLDFLQTAWTKIKTNIETWMATSKITWWLWNGHKLFLQRENLSMLAITEMQGLTIAFCFWILHILEMVQGKSIPFWILKGLARFIINEQCLILVPIRQTFASKVNAIQVLQISNKLSMWVDSLL